MKNNNGFTLLIACLMAAFMGLVRALAPRGVDALNTAGTFGDTITRTAEGSGVNNHLLLTFGTAPGSQVKLCTASTRPLGFAEDDAAAGAKVSVELLAGAATRIAIGSKAIAAGVRVYATAGGKLTDAVVAGAYLVGESLTACSADGAEFVIMPLSPVINPA